MNIDLKLSETLIDEFLNAKLIITLIEQLPKDKQLQLGTAELILAPFFFNTSLSADGVPPINTSASLALPITYINTKLLLDPAVNNAKQQSSDEPVNTTLPELDVEVNLDQPLIDWQELEQGGFLTIRPVELCPVPDEWNAKDSLEKDLNSNLYYYAMSFSIPLTAEQSRVVFVNGGQLLGPNDSLPGDGVTPQEQSINQKRVRWPTGKKFWLNSIALKALREKIVTKQGIDAEFARILQPKYAHLSDPNIHRYRGNCNIDISNLLVPDATTIDQRCYLTVGDNENVSLPNMAAVKDQKDQKLKAINVYKTTGSQLLLTLTLSRPLLEKKSIPIITKRVHDFIPKREPVAEKLQEKRNMNADARFHDQMLKVASQLCGEYMARFKSDITEMNAKEITLKGNMGDLKGDDFLRHLQKNGAYQQLKDQLKGSVAGIVRERFKKISPFASPIELQKSIGQVYVYLVDEMHKELNRLFHGSPSLTTIKPAEELVLELDALRRYADEAELDGDVPAATYYYQETLSKDEDNLQLWFEYGCFCLRTGATERGEECLREVISRNQRSVSSLLAYAALSTIQQQYERAETLFHAVVQMQPRNTLALAMQALHYEITGNDVECERVSTEAKNVHSMSEEVKPLYIQVAEFGLKIQALPYVERALAQELVEGNQSVNLYLKLAQLYRQGGLISEAEKQVQTALGLQLDSVEAWSALGHLHFLTKRFDTAQSYYESMLAFGEESPDAVIVFVRLGRIYLYSALVDITDYAAGLKQPDMARRAKTAFLEAAQRSPYARAWLGLGLVCWLLGEYEEAEEALAEASILNSRDNIVWSTIALNCLSRGRIFEATRAISHSLRQGLRFPSMLKSASLMFHAHGEERSAIECAKRWYNIEPSNVSAKELYMRIVPEQMREEIGKIK